MQISLICCMVITSRHNEPALIDDYMEEKQIHQCTFFSFLFLEFQARPDPPQKKPPHPTSYRILHSRPPPLAGLPSSPRPCPQNPDHENPLEKKHLFGQPIHDPLLVPRATVPRATVPRGWLAPEFFFSSPSLPGALMVRTAKGNRELGRID